MAAKKGLGLEYLGLREDGKKWWKARVKWRDKLTGRMREAEKTYAADSKPQALVARAKFLEEKRDGAARGPVERKRFSEAIDAYLATVTRVGTLHSYASHGRKLKKKLGDAWVDALETQHLQAVLGSYGHLSKPMVDGIRAVMINVFDHAKGLGWVTQNPAQATEAMVWRAKPKRARKALSPAEVVRLVADMRQHSYDMHVMVACMYVLGTRFAEISALTWEDVDMTTGHVRIVRGQHKGVEGPPKGNKEREAALGPTGLKMLAQHRKRMEQETWPGWQRLVFPAPPTGQGKKPGRRHDYWEWQTVAKHLRAAYGRIGLELGAVTHVARHTANNIARMHANEVFLRQVIGHSSVELSATYTEIAAAEVIDFAREQERRLFGQSGSPGGSSLGNRRKNI